MCENPFALLESEVSGGLFPLCVWAAQMLWCPKVAFKVTALLPPLGDLSLGAVSTGTVVRGITGL